MAIGRDESHARAAVVNLLDLGSVESIASIVGRHGKGSLLDKPPEIEVADLADPEERKRRVDAAARRASMAAEAAAAARGDLEGLNREEPDASKVAFVRLVRQLARWDFDLIDCQVHTEHLERFGAEPWPRARFLETLARSVVRTTRFGPWRFDEEDDGG